MSFHDPKTKRAMWYGSDMFHGERVEFQDVVSASPSHITFECLDGEHAKLPTDAVVFL